jgi:hypothetical protein
MLLLGSANSSKREEASIFKNSTKGTLQTTMDRILIAATPLCKNTITCKRRQRIKFQLREEDLWCNLETLDRAKCRTIAAKVALTLRTNPLMQDLSSLLVHQGSMTKSFQDMTHQLSEAQHLRLKKTQ